MEYRGIAWLFILVLTGTVLYFNHSDHGKLYCSASQNSSNLDLKLFCDGLSINSARNKFQSFTLLWLKTDCLIPNLACFLPTSSCIIGWLIQNLARRISCYLLCPFHLWSCMSALYPLLSYSALSTYTWSSASQQCCQISPVKWWKAVIKSYGFPRDLVALAVKLLSCPASCASIERFFSDSYQSSQSSWQ